MDELTLEQHKAEHAKLHKNLEKLIMDFLNHAKDDALLDSTSVLELLNWSHGQVENPTTPPNRS